MKTKKIAIVAISKDRDTLHKVLLTSAPNSQLLKSSVYDIDLVVFTQGFYYKTPNCYYYPFARIDRDDSVRCFASSMKEYFTEKVLSWKKYDYIYFLTEDTKIGPYFCRALLCDLVYMDLHPECGIIVHRYSSDYSRFGDPKTYVKCNPTAGFNRGGFLLRADSYNWSIGWGGDESVEYCEEVMLAMGAYMKGYEVVRSLSDSRRRIGVDSHSSGLGGRQALCKLGYCTPKTDDSGEPDYHCSCILDKGIVKLHKALQKEILSGGYDY